MKIPNKSDKAAIEGLTTEQVVRSIAHCQRKAAEIGLTPSAKEKNMLSVYRALYENRKALLDSMKEGHPELWTDFLDNLHHPRVLAANEAGELPDEARLLAEIDHYRKEASRLAGQESTHAQNLHLAYALMARHRSQQLETVRQAEGTEGEHPTE